MYAFLECVVRALKYVAEEYAAARAGAGSHSIQRSELEGCGQTFVFVALSRMMSCDEGET